jgi:hypothetical protein
MAQTKTRASSKRSTGSKKPQARSRGSSKKSANSRRQASLRKQPNSSKPAPTAAVSNAAGKATNAAGKATTAVGNAADKAKIPLVASGAALAGVAGGLVLGTRHARRHRGIGMAIPRRPQVKVKSADVAKAAKEVGSFGAQLGHLANELQQARESTNGGTHRSPLEVVLEGLTARRSRA